jgi:predicted HicB family RNase H-like nuclease
MAQCQARFREGVVVILGSTPAKVKEEFRISFDEYLNFCVERGGTPDESFTGAMEARVVADVYQAADAAAEPEGKTLNEWLGEAVGETTVPTA